MNKIQKIVSICITFTTIGCNSHDRIHIRPSYRAYAVTPASIQAEYFQCQLVMGDALAECRESVWRKHPIKDDTIPLTRDFIFDYLELVEEGGVAQTIRDHDFPCEVVTSKYSKWLEDGYFIRCDRKHTYILLEREKDGSKYWHVAKSDDE